MAGVTRSGTTTGQSQAATSVAPRAALARSALLQRQLAVRGPRGATPAPVYQARKAPYVAAKVVGSFVPGLTKKTFEKFGFATAQLITDWANVVGRDVARYTLPERLRWPRATTTSLDGDEGGGAGRGATLMLRVDPARALDVEYKRAQLMERINVYFGYRAVSEIRIVQGAVEPQQPATDTPARGLLGATPPLVRPKPSPQQRPVAAGGAVAPALNTVCDDALREALARMQTSIQAGRKPAP